MRCQIRKCVLRANISIYRIGAVLPWKDTPVVACALAMIGPMATLIPGIIPVMPCQMAIASGY